MAFADAEKGSCLHSVTNRYRAAVVNDGDKQKTLLKDTCQKQTQKQRMITNCAHARTRRRCDTRSAVIGKRATVSGSGRKEDRAACKRARTIDWRLKQPREITSSPILDKNSFSTLGEAGRDRQRIVSLGR